MSVPIVAAAVEGQSLTVSSEGASATFTNSRVLTGSRFLVYNSSSVDAHIRTTTTALDDPATDLCAIAPAGQYVEVRKPDTHNVLKAIPVAGTDGSALLFVYPVAQ